MCGNSVSGALCCGMLGTTSGPNLRQTVRRQMNRHLFSAVFATFLWIGAGGHANAQGTIEFNRDIRPILSDNCFYCHGTDAGNREADLRLDTFDGATSAKAFVPGKPEQSEALRRILSADVDEVMPPPDAEKHLTPAEIDLIRRWVKQGAIYQEHWAWQTVEQPKLPGEATAATAIDAFLQVGWEDNGAIAVAMATPREKLRRLSFDLRGLAPSAADVREFEKSPTDENLVQFRDAWMTELAYAEHQAVRWLDLVRWADTSGFVSDEPIASGAYRAWVIKSIHTNQPFDEFSIAQLAGDLLQDRTDDDLVASGYNRIVNTNCEAGAIEEEQLYKLKGEHVRAFGTVWMGMTTGCAECHDHKFDPISAKDYYSLAAFFDDLVEAGVYTPGDRREPLHYVYDEATARDKDQRLVSEMTRVKKKVVEVAVDGFSDWERRTLASLNDKKSRTDFVWIPTQLPAPRVLEGSYSKGDVAGKTVRRVHAKPSEFKRHHAAELMTGYINDGSQQTDAGQDAWFADVWIDPTDRPTMIGLQISHGDYGRLGWRTANYETYYWGTDDSATLKAPQSWNDPRRVKRLGDLPKESCWVRLRVPFNKRLKPVRGQSFESVGMAWMQTGGNLGWGDSGLAIRTDKTTALQLGETAIRKWWQQPKNRQVYQSRAEYVSRAVRKKAGDRDALQNEIVMDAYREQVSEQANPDWMQRLRSLESQLFVQRSQAIPVLVSRQANEMKTTRVLNRGDYQDKTGPIVHAAPPAFIDSIKLTGRDRLDLANWLFEDKNPLTARVYVNRLWHQFYGRGISETLEDLGTQGDWPSNIDLLNWLAHEFKVSGWDRNHMVRLLTSTKAYQLSSKPSADLAERDPGNRWHARQSRHRLTAEAIRDSALASAGLLVQTRKVPTQSFFPYQPDPYWTRSDKVMYGSRHMKWATSEKQSQYHRSLYTFWKRQNIHPTMLAFDAPTRQECTARRNITNTPGQALALLNDPIFVEAARVFAMRICESPGLSDEARIGTAFSEALQRKPTDGEVAVLIPMLGQLRERYGNSPDDAKKLVSIGQSPAPVVATQIEIAAWTGVARAILNLHEFLNRS